MCSFLQFGDSGISCDIPWCILLKLGGHAGGICWLSLVMDVDIMVTDVCDQAITCKLSKGGSFWWCLAVYHSPIPNVRNQFWDYQVNRRSSRLGPWMLLGDYNKIISLCQVIGGSFYSSLALKYGDMIENCGLLDIGFQGPAFTWHRNVNRYYHRISLRLDCALADCDWRIAFPEASCMHLHSMYSDHHPLFISLYFF